MGVNPHSFRSMTWMAKNGTRPLSVRPSCIWRGSSQTPAAPFCAGGFLHFGQGKWYPGESLPRWAFSCYWRSDALPLWRDLQWVADPDRNYGFGEREAQRFAEELARTLSIDPDYLISAYEDPMAYLLKSGNSPSMSIPKTTNSTIRKNASGCGAFSNEVLAIRLGSYYLYSVAMARRAGMADQPVDASRPASVFGSR